MREKVNLDLFEAWEFGYRLKLKDGTNMEQSMVLKTAFIGNLIKAEIDELMPFSKSTTTLCMNHLHENGYIEKIKAVRSRARGKGNPKIIRVTKKGVALLKEIVEDFDHHQKKEK